MSQTEAEPQRLFVVGNDACDADSLVCAWAVAQLLTSGGDPRIVTAVAQIPRAEYKLRRDCIKLFADSGCELDSEGAPGAGLRFWDELDWSGGLAAGAGLVLCDHNRMTPRVAEVFAVSQVEWVIDHHAPTGDTYTNARYELDQVGSACTLAAEQYLQAGEVPTHIGAMLLGVILLDTRNYNPEKGVGWGTERDAAAIERLRAFAPKTRDEWYDELLDARNDTSGFSVQDCVLCDSKEALTTGAPTRILFSAVPATLNQMIAKSDGRAAGLLESVQTVAKNTQCAAAVLLCAVAGSQEPCTVAFVPATPVGNMWVDELVSLLNQISVDRTALPEACRVDPLFEWQGWMDNTFRITQIQEELPLLVFELPSSISRKSLMPLCLSVETRRIRVGFIVGKTNDPVEDPAFVGDTAFLADLPKEYRAYPNTGVTREDHSPYGCPLDEGGVAHSDVAIAWWVKSVYGDQVTVDIIRGSLVLLTSS